MAWGVAHDLGTLSGDTGSDANQINNLGVIAGDSYDANGAYRAVVWESSRRILQLPSLPNWTYFVADGINDSGQIVGQAGPDAVGDYPAVLWQNKNVLPSSLAKPSGGGAGVALWINERCQIVGVTYPHSEQNWLPALWQGGSLIDLGVYGADPMGAAYGINNHGQIAGFSGQSFGDITTAHSLLWDNGTMVDLQTRIPANSGWVLQQALSIVNGGRKVRRVAVQ